MYDVSNSSEGGKNESSKPGGHSGHHDRNRWLRCNPDNHRTRSAQSGGRRRLRRALPATATQGPTRHARRRARWQDLLREVTMPRPIPSPRRTPRRAFFISSQHSLPRLLIYKKLYY